MNNQKAYKQGLAAVSRFWEYNDFPAALTKIEEMRGTWPGNSHLWILWASAVQLQEDTAHSLDDAKRALQVACEFDKTSPAGPIELGYFLDTVEDDPAAGAESFAAGAALARQLLCEALIGQAKTLLQLGKREDSLACLLEFLQVADHETKSKRHKADWHFILSLPALRTHVEGLNGRFADRARELFEELLHTHSPVM